MNEGVASRKKDIKRLKRKQAIAMKNRYFTLILFFLLPCLPTNWVSFRNLEMSFESLWPNLFIFNLKLRMSLNRPLSFLGHDLPVRT
jgi:hypothetical protein